MRIALSADWQFQSQTRFSEARSTGMTSRMLDFHKCWQDMIQAALARKCTALAVVGDMNDNRSAVDVPVIDLMCRCVRDAAEAFDQVWMLPGNHDSYLRNPSINVLPMFAGYATVIEDPRVHLESGAALGFVPWTEDLDALAAGMNAVADAGATVLLSHVLLEGAVPHGGIPVDALPLHRFKRVFLGDVHDPVTVGPAVQYIASPLQIDFRDAGKARGFRVYDTATDKGEFVDNTGSPRFHVVTEGYPLTNVRKGDFVTVDIADPDAAQTAVAKLAKVTGWVVSKRADAPAAAPRIAVHAKDSHEDAMAKYVRHKLPGADDALVGELVAMGVDIIEEAKP